MTDNRFYNTGDFRGANVFQGSTLKNVGEIVGAKFGESSAKADELRTILDQLNDALSELAPDRPDDAKAIATTAETLVKEAVKDAPNPSLLKVMGDALRSAAQAVISHAPSILPLAERILELIGKIRST